MGMAIELGKKEGSRKKLRNLLRIFSEGFVSNPFSTTSRALAHKGAETQKNGRKRKTITKKKKKKPNCDPKHQASV